MKIRVLVVDKDVNYMEEVKQYFSSSLGVEVVGTLSGKSDFFNFKESFDLLILNMLLDGNDSVEILDSVKGRDKKVIITSEFISSDMMNILNIYNPNYFIKKPFTMEYLENTINSISGLFNTLKNKDNELRVDITNLLHSLGVPSHIKGYNYIRDGIHMVVKNSNILGSMTKEVYPNIAMSYDTTSSRVERAIRHAIEVSWVRGDYSLMEEIFGNSIDYDRSKPTNSEFIATLADRLVLNKNYI